MGDLCWKRHIDQVRLADGSLLDREQDEDTRDCFQQAAPLRQLTGVVRKPGPGLPVVASKPALVPPPVGDIPETGMEPAEDLAVASSVQDPDVPGRGTERQTGKELRLESSLRRSRRQRESPTYLKDYCPK